MKHLRQEQMLRLARNRAKIQEYVTRTLHLSTFDQIKINVRSQFQGLFGPCLTLASLSLSF